ncbi:sodium:proton antiporter NhaD [Marinobacterium rhizophilum]|uniref:Sodium:proton antiporter NhaD n=1 Tax=Marinobacterium rhizophilum TaxID=420402 RepID=A0ABY5HQ65_9GAMM|nr:sodium:proton antiporter NhaD [Marinobacterium rhizophilum]
MVLCLCGLLGTAPALAATSAQGTVPDLTTSLYGVVAILIFVLAYIFVIGEEFFLLRKSKPMIVAAGLIWLLTGIAYAVHGDTETAGPALQHNILEYAEMFLFLLAAMTFVTTLEERQVFGALRTWLIVRQFSLRQVYWITGALAFVLSPVADNLSTALLMGAVVLAVGNGNRQFVTVGSINIVIAANAGGAFSPFGDITTLMVWQEGLVPFSEFGHLFLPSLVNWLVPALLMYRAVEQSPPASNLHANVQMRQGALPIIGIFLGTIVCSVLINSRLNMSPALGMMTGLGVLKLYGYRLARREPALRDTGHLSQYQAENITDMEPTQGDHTDVVRRFDIFHVVERASWDTLMFFYGVVLAVGGLAQLGYLSLASEHVYGTLGPTLANIAVGVLSAVIDNIPVMLAVLRMAPEMNMDQWLLVTLTAGVGGSLLSIGSAAGIALMGQAHGVYTFMSHLRWAWAIALGYALSVLCHLWLSGI